MFSRAERIITSVIGLCRSDIRPMALALDEIADLLFIKGRSLGEIFVTKDIYPAVACRLEKSPAAIARSVERVANLWWDSALLQGRINEFIGSSLYNTPSVCEILYYLSFFLYYNKPFFSIFDDLDCLDTPATSIYPSA